MKKFLLGIAVLLIVLLVAKNWERVKFWSARVPELAQEISNDPVLAELKDRVVTGGALRGQEDYKQSRLTIDGVVKYTNMARQENVGLPKLVVNRELTEAAARKVEDMFERQYFEHIAPDGKGPAELAKAAGYEYVMVGENLAMGNFKDDESLVTAWMNSPGHRANILNGKYTEIGVAVGQGQYNGKKIWMAVQEFGKPLSDCPVISPVLKASLDILKSELAEVQANMKKLKLEMENMPEPETQQQADIYNSKVREYNALVKIYNNKVDFLKQSTGEYNAQVEKFNQCAE